MTRARKTPADLRADVSAPREFGEGAADHAWDSDEYRALVAAGLRAPNQRHFTITSADAWDLFRPDPTMLPQFPPSWTPKVERDED